MSTRNRRSVAFGQHFSYCTSTGFRALYISAWGSRVTFRLRSIGTFWYRTFSFSTYWPINFWWDKNVLCRHFASHSNRKCWRLTSPNGFLYRNYTVSGHFLSRHFRSRDTTYPMDVEEAKSKAYLSIQGFSRRSQWAELCFIPRLARCGGDRRKARSWASNYCWIG